MGRIARARDTQQSPRGVKDPTWREQEKWNNLSTRVLAAGYITMLLELLCLVSLNIFLLQRVRCERAGPRGMAVARLPCASTPHLPSPHSTQSTKAKPHSFASHRSAVSRSCPPSFPAPPFSLSRAFSEKRKTCDTDACPSSSFHLIRVSHIDGNGQFSADFLPLVFSLLARETWVMAMGSEQPMRPSRRGQRTR